MKNILAILTMVSFSALAAEESDTQKLDNVLDKSKETGKNVMVIVSNGETTKREDIRKAFRNGNVNFVNMLFMNTKEFKDYQKEYLLVIKFNVNDIKDLPEKVKNDFKVKSIPSVILVKNGKVVHRLGETKSVKQGVRPLGRHKVIHQYKWFDDRYKEVIKDSQDVKQRARGRGDAPQRRK